MNSWKPVIYRGDGAWIGRMAGGEIGVGTENEHRASLKAAGLRPMWPFLEKELKECRDEFDRNWGELCTPDFSTPEELLAATIETAWRSGSKYWMLLSVERLADTEWTNLGRSLLAEIRVDMLASDLVDDKRKSSIWR